MKAPPHMDLEEDRETGGGTQTLDDLIGNVRDLELEVGCNVSFKL